MFDDRPIACHRQPAGEFQGDFTEDGQLHLMVAGLRNYNLGLQKLLSALAPQEPTANRELLACERALSPVLARRSTRDAASRMPSFVRAAENISSQSLPHRA
ncbi:hypothetical protein DYI37_04440 [Fulvimarina endophytica]|uniref:Uncharacterized protein n=1 Tax=Fulvimarina endophytica TaxID=2293836 RepID=A0A371X7B3_9HYPH|nr:hypothetical protein [Fulvimarina endophytica]RFC65113.1 hypothetical protein DYI37_04440 [Fulvimarina endophytica]